jgi:hypothetical protein
VLLGVGHPANNASCVSGLPRLWAWRFSWYSAVADSLLKSRAAGVGHPERSVSDMRRTDARRRKRDTPEGVTQGFHVSLYKVDPRLDSFARNLLSKDDCRAALLDEPVEVRPKVPLVIKPASFAC